MKILQVIDSLHAGGAERVLIDTTNLLTEGGYDVTVLALLTRGELASQLHSSVRVIELNRSFKFSLPKVFAFMRMVNEYDVVHIHMRHVLHYFWFGSLFRTCRSIIFFHDHFGDIELNKTVPHYLFSLRNQLTYIGVSRQLCLWAKDTVRIPVHRVFFLGNIVTFDAKKRNLSRRGNYPAKLIVVSNFKRIKNIEFSIHVVAALAPYRNIHLDVYGRELDTVYRAELEDLCDQLNVREHVRFVINEIKVRSVLPEYDLALHTSHSETGPLVLIEYLATHLPFVAYTTGEVTEQLKNDFPLFFLPHFDKQEWKDRVLELLDKDWSSYADRFDTIFSAHYSKDNYVKKLVEIYSQNNNTIAV